MRGTNYLEKIQAIQDKGASLSASDSQDLREFKALSDDGMNVMLSASDSTKRLGLLKSATMNLKFLELAQSLNLDVFVGLGDSFRRLGELTLTLTRRPNPSILRLSVIPSVTLGLSSPAVLARVSSLAALANFRTVQPGSQPDVLQNQSVALYRSVVERWRDRDAMNIEIGTALMVIENRCGEPYEYTQTYLDGLKMIGSNKERQLAFSRKAKKSLGPEEPEENLSMQEIAQKVDGYRAIEKALYEMELRDADPTLLGLYKATVLTLTLTLPICLGLKEAVEKWSMLFSEKDAIVKYLSSPDGIRGAPTMSVSVESQAVLCQISDPAERGQVLQALKSETGQDDATDTIAGLLREGEILRS